MNLNYLAFAVPLFLGFMLLEYLVSRQKRKNYFKFHSSVANISIGVLERLCDVFVTASFYYVYDHLKRNYGLFDIKPGVFLWILLFLLTDFIWYWYHRLAHEINVLWAVHIVHHQSEEFNYTASARITVLQAIARTGFWAVLPLIGFPAAMITSLLIVHGLYPFFIHTRLIGKLGILEYLFVTPSHHRVHHGSDEKYLDKNYGDVFIIWDKLFGTFKKEEEEPVYGLTQPLQSYSFLWQHFHFFIEMGLALKTEKSWRKKWKIIFGRPVNVDKQFRYRAEQVFAIQHRPEKVSDSLNMYVVYQMAGVLLTLFIFILYEHYIAAVFQYSYAIVLVLTLINCGAILEQKKWVFNVELLRAGVLFIAGIIMYRHYNITIGYSLLFMAIAAIYYPDMKRKYLKQVYRGEMRLAR